MECVLYINFIVAEENEDNDYAMADLVDDTPSRSLENQISELSRR